MEQGGGTHNAIMFVPPTPGGVLKSMLQSRTDQLTNNEGLKIKFIESGGLKLKNILARNNPFPTPECQDKICPVCKKTDISDPGTVRKFRAHCQTEGVGYRVVCLNCKKKGKFASYEGETGRSAKVRFKEHIRSLKNRSKSSALFKHGNNEHPYEKPDWQFKILSTFQDPLSRQVNEAVRINNLPVNSVLNSKSEFNHAPLNRISIKKS